MIYNPIDKIHLVLTEEQANVVFSALSTYLRQGGLWGDQSNLTERDKKHREKHNSMAEHLAAELAEELTARSYVKSMEKK